MQTSPIHTKTYLREALADSRLREAVDKATQTALKKRADKVEQVPWWEDLRHQAHHIKKETLDHLDTYLERFTERCKGNGIIVHWARDAEEARRLILEVMHEKGVKKVVKSKSLTTEELHLNHFLAENGVESLETDLGEYIVQLLDQIPSHLTAPALHLTRVDVGRIFHEKLGVPYTEDPDELLQIARARLREKFLDADMGISGVNFAMAEEGSFCILENEANGFLTVGLPRIHLAVMGIEKLIPDLASLAPFLKLLPISATGQKITSYLHLIGGPRQAATGEGPEEVHLLLLDNGRSSILADGQLRETLFCIRCGACLNVCPIYQQVGGHAYGWVYMGPIGITLIPQYLGAAEGRYAPYVSSLCGACYEICPVRINIPHHLLKLRNRIVESHSTGVLERAAFRGFGWLASHPRLYRFATWFPGKLQQLLPGERAFRAPGYGAERALGRFDRRGFRKRYKSWLRNRPHSAAQGKEERS
ncbi:MAG TPA: LutB/LldF family L-lactate oxidation iron-sulfur protein [bacterium]|nr:LutB/LldF family L-lactate oxidation iron-sulfur protein [bacterium]HPR89564.1 LutB/LldF family L-lactate oxidation iron-sulfur protein [bacterium]